MIIVMKPTVEYLHKLNLVYPPPYERVMENYLILKEHEETEEN